MRTLSHCGMCPVRRARRGGEKRPERLMYNISLPHWNGAESQKSREVIENKANSILANLGLSFKIPIAEIDDGRTYPEAESCSNYRSSTPMGLSHSI